MKSIALKLWSGMMVLIVVVLILLWLFQIVFLDSFYTDQKITSLKKEGLLIVSTIERADKAEFQNRLEKLAYDSNANIELLDAKGNILYSTGSSMQMIPMMFNNLISQSLQDVLGGKLVTTPFTHPRMGSQIELIGIPVKVSGQIQGALFINMPLAPVKDTVIILKKQLIYITLLLLIAALILSFLLSRSFTKPILEITKAADHMASGNFSIRIPSQSGDEIGRLAKTINHMGEELSKIEGLRKDLIANVSHELRTPLSLIRGYAETIRDVSGNTPEKRNKQLEIIIEESERLGKLVEDILHLSQLQSGYYSLTAGKFNAAEVLESVAKKYEIISEQTGIRLLLENVKAVPVVGDGPRIEQVLYNLVNNAFNHTSRSGCITIKAVEKERFVKILVSDTGSGISEEDIEHIWNRYFKADKSSGKRQIGTGLGLAIVKGILEAHKAPYGVESKIGLGTTFWFELEKAEEL